MDNLLILKTESWQVTHRRDSRYSGYLIASSVLGGCGLSDLPSSALRELGGVLTKAEGILQRAYSPNKGMVAKLGFSKGFSCHFHVVPATASLLRAIVAHPACSNEPDGNDAMLFVSREYCERDLTRGERYKMEQVVERLRGLS